MEAIQKISAAPLVDCRARRR
ncbi:hypothetical protein Q6283_29925 [Klebsiella pneumoniae]|nr:hypothetical protein [Klebsiella pneumoniae]MDP0953500.1 hypothetical protein [Klebsiella pneumoniae]